MSKKNERITGVESVDDTPDVLNYRTMTLFNACDRKRALGVVEHGPVYNGDPIEDALAEMCDALNYLDFAERVGHDPAQVDAIRSVIVDAATRLRELPPITGTVRTDW